MLIERQARAKERRVVPETIARFMIDAAVYAQLNIKPVTGLAHTFDLPNVTPGVLCRYERESTWRFGPVASRYPRCSADRDTADSEKLEWVTPGHPLFEAVRRHVLVEGQEPLHQGACYCSLLHEQPVRIDIVRARVVDGLATSFTSGFSRLKSGKMARLNFRSRLCSGISLRVFRPPRCRRSHRPPHRKPGCMERCFSLCSTKSGKTGSRSLSG